LVAASPEEYVNLAVQLASDRERIADLRRRLLAAAPRFFEFEAVIDEHLRFYTSLGRE
jgi:predicted O-linked N-acetylglucosamine transferase (SPINDLY family)